MKNCKKSRIKHPRKISLWYKETGMPRLEKMPTRTGKARVGVTATSNQMREASGSWNLLATMI